MGREDGEVHEKHHRRRKSRSRSRHRARSRSHERRARRDKPKKKEPQPKPEDTTIINENMLIEQQLLLDTDELARLKRLEREQFLSKYRVAPPEVARSSSAGSSSEPPLQVVPVEQPAVDLDVGRQHYLKMLESLRDQEVGDQLVKRRGKEVMDMFEDDVDDSPLPIDGTGSVEVRAPLEADDELRYYRATVGETMNRDYRVVQSKSGKGVFSNVVKAVNQLTNSEVAIKMLRSEEIYQRSGERERTILLKLNEQDKNSQMHIIRMLDSFEYRKHLCLVFESMDTNLREYIRSTGKGLTLETVRSFAINLFKALGFLRKQKIIHADIKPDNILISKDHSCVKLCDFGTAFSVEESSLVDYLQSRFYRAPEVIVGYPYDTQLDVWSTACTLFELYTGKFLFNGINNNEMLKLHIQTMGKFSLKILRRGAFISKYFDQNHTFLQKDIDPVTKSEYYKPILLGEKPTRTLIQLLKVKEAAEDQKQLLQFKDLLEKCLQLDPKNRMTPDEALLHPFIAR